MLETYLVYLFIFGLPCALGGTIMGMIDYAKSDTTIEGIGNFFVSLIAGTFGGPALIMLCVWSFTTFAI